MFKASHLIMSGGGVKGIAYVGALKAAEQMGFRWFNIAGVSAGALVGSIASVGYTAGELEKLLHDFEFEKVKDREVFRRVPAIRAFKRWAYRSSYVTGEQLKGIVAAALGENAYRIRYAGMTAPRMFPPPGARSILGKIVGICSKNYLFDGEYIEDWVKKKLENRGIVTFGDLRGGVVTEDNPLGYRMRMTAVDADRMRVIVLPYDISYYGINPDALEVAKAVRMSAAAPFVFRPVELEYVKNGRKRISHIVDGGVIDNFPTWLFNKSAGYPVTGLSLSGKREYYKFDTPLNILKSIVLILYDFGVPPDCSRLNRLVEIDTSRVSTFDFDLDEGEKQYLHDSGAEAVWRALSVDN